MQFIDGKKIHYVRIQNNFSQLYYNFEIMI